MDEKTVNINKRKIYVTLLIVVICLIGVTYAFFTLYLRQSEENTITSLSCFSTTFTEETNAISLEKTYAVTEDEGMSYSPFTFKIKNNCTDTIYAYITIDSLNEGTSTNLDSSHVRYNLSTKGTTDGISATLKPSSTKKLENGHNGYVIKTLALGSNEELEYDLRLWVDEKTTASEGLSKTWSGQVVIVSDAEEPNIDWNYTGQGTLLAAIKRDNTVTETLTQPGKEVSAHTLDDVPSQTANVSTTSQAYYVTYGTGWEANGTKFNLTGASVTSDTYANSYSSLVGKYLINTYIPYTGSSTAGEMQTTTDLDSVYYVVSATATGFTYKTLSSNKNTIEALLASTEDDYGISYYFRGAVTNNYVEFANKCWRIVRVGGDGSVKLILHNDNTAGAANPCNSANNSDDAAFARCYGPYYTNAFNTNKDDNAYVGFKYGTAGASDYATTHANTNKSAILTYLETWYNNNLKTYESVIDNSVWCNDKTNVTDTSYDPGGGWRPNGLGYAKNVTYYGATQRLISTSGSAGGTGPSLKCNGELSKITSKIGLITADELAFAGYAYRLNNSTTYLQENVITSWRALSPFGFHSDGAYVWTVLSNGGGLSSSRVDYSFSVRPSISLKSTTNVSGDGTSSSPYKIVS
ncbi:MAG: hypothetical protein MST00_05590 [Tenericutes bacterium]|nr:hypothetical protein [Mycoplasmatota bacterium]